MRPPASGPILTETAGTPSLVNKSVATTDPPLLSMANEIVTVRPISGHAHNSTGGRNSLPLAVRGRHWQSGVRGLPR